MPHQCNGGTCGHGSHYDCVEMLLQIIGMGAGAAEEIKGIAKALFMQLEKDKPSLAPLDPVKDREHCINFALRIFRNADRADCAGQADLNTCKAYYAASIFLQVGAGQTYHETHGGIENRL